MRSWRVCRPPGGTRSTGPVEDDPSRRIAGQSGLCRSPISPPKTCFGSSADLAYRLETASRLRGRNPKRLRVCVAGSSGCSTLPRPEACALANPARWRGHLDAVLPRRQKLTRGHHKAMPFDQVSRSSIGCVEWRALRRARLSS